MCVVGVNGFCVRVWWKVVGMWLTGCREHEGYRFLVCYTKKKEMTLLVIPHEISLRYVLEAIFVARTVWTLDKNHLLLDA